MNQYQEVRQHEMRKLRLIMIGGELQTNQNTVDVGTSARIFRDGYWGFSSVPQISDSAKSQMTAQANANAQAMSTFGKRPNSRLPSQKYVGRHEVKMKPALTAAQISRGLKELDAACLKLSGVKKVRFQVIQEFHHKSVTNSVGSDVVSQIARSAINIVLIGQDSNGAPVEVYEPVSWRGTFADYDWSPKALGELLREQATHLEAKCKAVAAKGGLRTVIIAPNLAGMLAHEGMGHPCEADLVIGGAVTSGLRNKSVASPLVTMIDYAHHRGETECMMPVYADDEGTPASDAVLIKDGILTDFMNSRETAKELKDKPTGSARAYMPNDEPLVRMRNTGIVPGKSKLADMISEVDQGYMLMGTGNGQADSTTEFMFGITLGYEIKNGKLGSAIKDTTVSGSAIKVLQSVDAVSDDDVWGASGYCGKKQPMVVSMGGPALRTKLQVGGA
jgi:TldD protein